MKNLTQTLITAILALVVVVLFTAQSFAQTECVSNSKLLFHGTKPINENSNWGIGGWLVIPNPGANVILGVAGPRYEVKNKWSLEIMAGTFSKNNEGQSVIDIRASYDAFDPIHVWGNIEYYPKSKNWYSYLDVNYRIGQLGLVGIETENMHFADTKDDLSVGPRLVLPFKSGQFVLIGAYQFHNGDNPNQIWTRAVFNF